MPSVNIRDAILVKKLRPIIRPFIGANLTALRARKMLAKILAELTGRDELSTADVEIIEGKVDVK